MQRGGKMNFKGLAKQLAPTVAPIAGKAINAALSKAFSYGRKRIRKKHSQKLDLVKQLFNKANLGCRVFPCCRKRCQVVAEKEDKELSGDKVLGWPWLLLPIYLVY